MFFKSVWKFLAHNRVMKKIPPPPNEFYTKTNEEVLHVLFSHSRGPGSKSTLLQLKHSNMHLYSNVGTEMSARETSL